MIRPTIYELAVLADDVYNERDQLAVEIGWRRTKVSSGFFSEKDPGFQGALYEKNGGSVVAFRGTTLSKADIWDADAAMIPGYVSKQKAQKLLSDLSQIYMGKALTKHNDLAIVGISYAVDKISLLKKRKNQSNSIPVNQVRDATDFIDDCRYDEGAVPDIIPNVKDKGTMCKDVRYVTGHSLGGALAKVVALNDPSLRGVAFNSPFMGELEGVKRISASNLLSIDAEFDPLSYLTNKVGNLPHGRRITVKLANCILSSTKINILSSLSTVSKLANSKVHTKLLGMEFLRLMGHNHSMSNLSRALNATVGGLRDTTF